MAQQQSSSLPTDDAIPSRSLTPSYVASPSTRSRKLSVTPRVSLDSENIPKTSPLVDPYFEDIGSQDRDDSHSFPRDIERGRSLDHQSGINALPFPTQPDPLKPLRPRNYRIKKNAAKLRGFVKRNEGILLLSFAQLFFSTMNFFYKLINLLPPEESAPVTALEIILVRMSITWVGCVGFMLISGVESPFLGPKEVRKLLALRGFVGFFGLCK